MSNKAETMKKKSKRTLTPKLRFPEFRDDDAWQKLPVGKVLAVRDEKRAASKNVPLYSLTIENGVTEKTARYNREFLVTNSKKKYKVVKYDDLVYNPSNLRWGAINFSRVNHDVVVSPIYEVLYISQPDGNSAAYVQYALMRPEQIQLFIRMGQGTLIERIAVKIEDFIATSMPLPTPPEQQKIADCLSSLDGLIAAADRMLEALKAHKKGLMQQLFPQPGQTQPRLRFPEFRDKGEWEEKPLSVIAENLDNKRVPITGSDRVKGDIPYYGASGIVDYVRDCLFDEDLLCISEDGANLVARSYPVAFPISGKTWVNNHAHVLRFDKPATQKMVEDYLNSIDLRDFITGMAQPKLNRTMLDTIPIPLPEQHEQQCIATCLTALDTRIAAQAAKIEILKQHKRGLMQQLFPAPEEE